MPAGGVGRLGDGLGQIASHMVHLNPVLHETRDRLFAEHITPHAGYEGDIAAAVRGMKLDAGPPQNVIAGQQVFQVAVAAERDHVRMLDKEKQVGQIFPVLGLDEALLQSQRR